MYVGRGCPLVQNKTHNAALVASFNSVERKRLCELLSDQMEFCGQGPQCPTLARAILGFHVVGDSLTSQRLFDVLLSGTIPVFTHHLQYGATQSWILWDKLSYFADISNATLFLSQVRDILKDTELLQWKQQQVLQNRRLFDWDSLVPFDTYMYMLQASVYPYLRHNSSVYSALDMPR